MRTRRMCHLKEQQMFNDLLSTQKFTIGDHVKKRSGSEWVGHVVGWYSTKLTPEGYAVESESHKGSVQIYPASALELVTL